MDRAFWQSVVDAGYALHSTDDAPALTTELLGYLGSPDSELRDNLAYPVLEQWIHRGYYTAADLKQMVSLLGRNLHEGLGTVDSDSVFLRSFSCLVLAELLHEDASRGYLLEGEVLRLLEEVLAYYPAEQDIRGYIQDKGWAHAVAHGADLLWELSRNKYVGAPDLQRILNCVSSQIAPAGAPVYVWNEDQRLVRAVLGALGRDIVPLPALKSWLAGLTYRDGRQLSVAGALDGYPPVALEEDCLAVLLNTRNFLTALSFHLNCDEDPPAAARALLRLIVDALRPLQSA
jgi:Protein of unknown function (DUF2785)